MAHREIELNKEMSSSLKSIDIGPSEDPPLFRRKDRSQSVEISRRSSKSPCSEEIAEYLNDLTEEIESLEAFLNKKTELKFQSTRTNSLTQSNNFKINDSKEKKRIIQKPRQNIQTNNNIIVVNRKRMGSIIKPTPIKKPMKGHVTIVSQSSGSRNAFRSHFKKASLSSKQSSLPKQSLSVFNTTSFPRQESRRPSLLKRLNTDNPSPPPEPLLELNQGLPQGAPRDVREGTLGGSPLEAEVLPRILVPRFKKQGTRRQSNFSHSLTPSNISFNQSSYVFNRGSPSKRGGAQVQCAAPGPGAGGWLLEGLFEEEDEKEESVVIGRQKRGEPAEWRKVFEKGESWEKYGRQMEIVILLSLF